MSSISFPIINSVKRGYPPDAGAHIAISKLDRKFISLPSGTIRRFLEHWGQGVDAVVFCLSDLMEFNLYHKILPLYFPRNLREEVYSKQELPRDIGNEFGETVIEERKIKISAFPGLARMLGILTGSPSQLANLCLLPLSLFTLTSLRR
jgi:hypothetical protein